MSTEPTSSKPVLARYYDAWYKLVRFVRHYREVIMIVLTVAVSLAFIAYGFARAIELESVHPEWFPKGF
jgi:hypothetical protein